MPPLTDGPLEQLIRRLGRLPGLGPRSARRVALHLLRHRESLMLPLAREMEQVASRIRECDQCGNLDLHVPCHLCSDSSRDASRICVVEDVADLWAIERAAVYAGQYLVLGGVMNALDGIGPDQLRLPLLLERASDAGVSEVILATSATVDGQTTAHYIAEKLAGLSVSITRLAHGVPVGGELNYLDDGTLAQAMRARRRV